jgi:hypothetical protein
MGRVQVVGRKLINSRVSVQAGMIELHVRRRQFIWLLFFIPRHLLCCALGGWVRVCSYFSLILVGAFFIFTTASQLGFGISFLAV